MTHLKRTLLSCQFVSLRAFVFDWLHSLSNVEVWLSEHSESIKIALDLTNVSRECVNEIYLYPLILLKRSSVSRYLITSHIPCNAWILVSTASGKKSRCFKLIWWWDSWLHGSIHLRDVCKRRRQEEEDFVKRIEELRRKKYKEEEEAKQNWSARREEESETA